MSEEITDSVRESSAVRIPRFARLPEANHVTGEDNSSTRFWGSGQGGSFPLADSLTAYLRGELAERPTDDGMYREVNFNDVVLQKASGLHQGRSGCRPGGWLLDD